MYKYGFFRDISDNLYKVVIITDYQQYNSNLGQGQGEEITLLANPISIEYDSNSDDVFAPYRCSTMTVRFLQSQYDEELNNALGNNVFVTLQKEEGGRYKTIWQGFATPNAYNQAFINVVGDEFELEAQDALSTLKYCKFKRQETKHHLTIKDYIQLAFYQLNGLFKTCIYPTTPNNFLDICIPQENWFDEDNEAMSYLEILEEICKYLGFTLTTEGESIILLDPHCDEYAQFNLQSGEIQTVTFIRENETLNKEDISSDDCNVSLLPSYNKVSLTAKHYPVEKKIPKFADMELDPCSGYGVKGQYGASIICDETGEDSLHVQLFKVFNNQIGAHNVFLRYNHFDPYEDFTFYSYPKDENKEYTTKLPISNETVLNKDFLFSHNVSAPCEIETQEIKKEEFGNVPKSVSLKKAFIFQTAFGNSQNKELFLDLSKQKDDWSEINQTINQVLFSHRIARVTTNDNPFGNIVNINFNFSCYWGSYLPCKKLQKNDYKELLYRLRFADKYYNDKEKKWQDKPYNCEVFYDDGGNIIQNTNTDWKQSLIYGEHKGINIPLPINQSGDVFFEFMRPFTSMRQVAKIKKGALFDEKYYEKYRSTEGCNLITDYEATIYGLSYNTDDTETVYENVLSDNKFIEEKSDIELKVCTFEDGKATSYSSPYFYSQEKGVQILRGLDYGLYFGTPEDNIITRAINQYQTPQLKMEITLNRELSFISSITSSWFPDKNFIPTSYTFDPQQMNYTYTFLELKDISTFQPIVKKDKNRKQKRNGDLINHDETKPRVVRSSSDDYNMSKPTAFNLRNNHLIMTI
nr:MAG TPA: hypothetical protein [Caudoviricetes sp.]